MGKNSFASDQNTDEDSQIEFDQSLRPKSWAEYIGQDLIKRNLNIAIEAARQRQEALDHVLLSGPPGLGKTTLAHIIANQMQGNFHTTSGPAIERSGDLAAILTSLEPGDILFIDEVHRLPKTVEEILYPAMEDYCLDLVMGKGAGARSVKIDLPKFTLVAATTRSGALSSPLRDRFGLAYHLQFYQPEEIAQIITNSAKKLQFDINQNSALTIARRSRQTPRIANRLLKRVRDFAQVKNALIDQDLAEMALDQLAIDKEGLEVLDRELIKIIINNYAGGPVGITTLAAATGQERETLEDVYEPYLIQAGYIQKTFRGRKATEKAYKHLDILYNKER